MSDDFVPKFVKEGKKKQEMKDTVKALVYMSASLCILPPIFVALAKYCIWLWRNFDF